MHTRRRLGKTLVATFLIIVSCLCGNGCLTVNMWKEALDNNYVLVYKYQLSEDEYKKCLECMSTTNRDILVADNGDILVRRSLLEKTMNCAFATLVTPIVLTVDGISYIIKTTPDNPPDFSQLINLL